MPGAPVAVGDEDEAEAGPREGATIVDERVADDALADAHGAHRLERERAEMERRREHHREGGSLRHQAIRHGSREVARGERVDADGKVRAVLLERAHREDHDGARAIERVERGRRHLFQTVDVQKLLPLVAAK